MLSSPDGVVRVGHTLTVWMMVYLRTGTYLRSPPNPDPNPDPDQRSWSSDYTKINPQNLRPVFTQEQLASSLRASYYLEPVLQAVGLMDIGQLHDDIPSAQKSDKHSSDTLSHFSL